MNTKHIPPSIPESAFEHRIDFDMPWIDKWGSPNPFIEILYLALREWEVALADFSFNVDAKTVGDVQLTIAVRKLRSSIRVGLDHVIFHTANPDWDEAEKLVPLFERALDAIRSNVFASIKKQDSVIVFHVSPGSLNLEKATEKLVNVKTLGEAKSFGISIYREDSSLVIERSLRYEGGIFFRINKSFGPDIDFATLAIELYNDEISALRLLGIENLA